MKRYRYTVIIEKDEDGVYIASCPALPGCHTQGDTYDEALENLKDAINLNIAARRDLDADWIDEAEKRYQELRQGKVSGIPANEVFAQIREELR